MACHNSDITSDSIASLLHLSTQQQHSSGARRRERDPIEKGKSIRNIDVKHTRNSHSWARPMLWLTTTVVCSSIPWKWKSPHDFQLFFFVFRFFFAGSKAKYTFSMYKFQFRFRYLTMSCSQTDQRERERLARRSRVCLWIILFCVPQPGRTSIFRFSPPSSCFSVSFHFQVAVAEALFCFHSKNEISTRDDDDEEGK